MDLKSILVKAGVNTSGAPPQQPRESQQAQPAPEAPPTTPVLQTDVNGAPPVILNIPATPETPIEEIKALNIPDPTAEYDSIENCSHLCEKCNEWWSHGLRSKCRHPDVLRQGLCTKCLTGANLTHNPQPLDDLIEDDRGKKTLNPMYQIKVRNEERYICKNMDIEQLSLHIQHIYKRELEMRARGAEARKMRAELIDFEAQDVPEAEREAFKLALLQGKKPKERKSSGVKKLTKAEQKEKEIQDLAAQLKADGCENAKLVAQWMIQTGKSRKQVEALLND